jgi:hypothetical protein
LGDYFSTYSQPTTTFNVNGYLRPEKYGGELVFTGAARDMLKRLGMALAALLLACVPASALSILRVNSRGGNPTRSIASIADIPVTVAVGSTAGFVAASPTVIYTASEAATATSVARLAISNTTFVSGTPSGTAVGTISVTMAPATPAFSGMLSLSTTAGGCNSANGASNANWQISGNSLRSASDSLFTNQSVCVLASQGNSVLGLPITLIAAPPGYFVATTGSDASAGTISAPFATVQKCQSAMLASGGSKLACYIRSGTYNMASGGIAWVGGTPGGINMKGADSGELWETYPPDGCDSAVLSGQANGIGVMFSNNGASNLTINCLTMANFSFAGISSTYAYGAGVVTGQLYKNNIMHDIGIGNGTGASGVHGVNIVNSTVTHNVFYNMYDRAVSDVGNVSNLSVSWNVAYRTCINIADCGALYVQNISGTSTGVAIKNNFVRDVSPNQNSSTPLYADDCLSSSTWSGNILTGNTGYDAIRIHGGQNNVFSGNIIDITSYGQRTAGAITSGRITFYIGSLYSCPGGNPGPSNKFIQNIIVSNTNLGGSYDAYSGMGFAGPPPYPPTIGGASQANDYYAYSGSTSLSTGRNGLSGFNDTNPQNVNPQFSGCYSIAAGSPVFSAPINFPAQAANDLCIGFGKPGYWGPPGYTIPQNESSSSLPSYPSPTC